LNRALKERTVEDVGTFQERWMRSEASKAKV